MSPPPYQLPDDEAAAMYARYQQGISLRQLAIEFGHTRRTVRRNLARRGLELRPSRPGSLVAELGPVINGGATMIIPLAGVSAKGRTALIDAADYPLVGDYRWHLMEQQKYQGRTSGPYVATTAAGVGRRVFMHTLITGYPLTDHINHNGLDNRRSNLRAATTAQNNHNQRPQIGTSSRFKGVTWHKQIKKWQAAIKIDGRCVYLGVFLSEEEAALAYNAAALDAYGEYAYLNEVTAA